MMRLHDTLTASTRPLHLRRHGEVSIYACGPTVYDHPHLGHARSALTYDVLRRYLEWRGLKVRHVANITDIDDKIIARAQQEGRTESEVAEEWEAVYTEKMAALGVLEPHERPHATEWVGEMVRFVDILHGSGKAYTTDSGVYLRVREVPGYGDLVGRDLDSLRAAAGSRVEVDKAKEDPLDFALWKAAKPGEPVWDSPWGEGRPGWHIECTAMSLGLLGDGFDLHGGGDDLVFPHHTNERAQALAAGRVFAGHWMHNAMLNIDGAKMAKSLGNFRTVADLLDEHPRNGRALRLLVLQTHYRKTMEVNADLIAAARAAAGRLDAMARRAAAIGITGQPPSSNPASVETFKAAMDNDMGTPEAVAFIFETLRQANAALDADSEEAATLVSTVVELAGALGMETDDGISGSGSPATAGKTTADTSQDTASDQETTSNQDGAIKQLVERRQAARQAKDWETADALRDHLQALGVTVEDTPAGSIWHRS